MYTFLKKVMYLASGRYDWLVVVYLTTNQFNSESHDENFSAK